MPAGKRYQMKPKPIMGETAGKKKSGKGSGMKAKKKGY